MNFWKEKPERTEAPRVLPPQHDEPSKDDKHRYIREYDRERRKRATRLTHWALDMPPDEDETKVNVRNGFGWKELAVIGGTILGGGGLYQYINQFSSTQPITTSPSAIAPVDPADSEYDVRFYDKDGNLIEVPRKPKGGD